MTRQTEENDARAPAGESFLERFHRRKTGARQHATEPSRPQSATLPGADLDDSAPEPALPTSQPALTDADMPPLDTLTADSDYTGFLSEQVSETLRKAALRKLFHGASFNITDGLDEYADDFTTFEALGDIITADMRHMLEVEARKKAEAARQALLSGEAEVDAENEPTLSVQEEDEDSEEAARLLTTSATLSPSHEHQPAEIAPSRTTES
jgi:hypothetical protein